MQCKKACPLYPRKRTLIASLGIGANSGHCTWVSGGLLIAYPFLLAVSFSGADVWLPRLQLSGLLRLRLRHEVVELVLVLRLQGRHAWLKVAVAAPTTIGLPSTGLMSSSKLSAAEGQLELLSKAALIWPLNGNFASSLSSALVLVAVEVHVDGDGHGRVLRGHGQCRVERAAGVASAPATRECEHGGGAGALKRDGASGAQSSLDAMRFKNMALALFAAAQFVVVLDA